MAIDLDAYLAKYAPPPDDSNDWRTMLRVAGLTMLGARKGDELQRLGNAGLLAMDVGAGMKKQRADEQRQKLNEVASMWKLAKDEEQTAQKNSLIQSVMSRYGGGAPGSPQSAPAAPGGMSSAPPGMPATPGGRSTMPPAPPGMPPSPAGTPMPGAPTGMGGPPGLNPDALVLSLMGMKDPANLIQGVDDKAAEWGAITIGRDGSLVTKRGPVGMVLPDGSYALNGQFHPANPELKAAARAGDVLKMQDEINKAAAIAGAQANVRPFVRPGTNEVTNELAAATGGAGAAPSPLQIKTGEAQLANAAAREKEYTSSADNAAAHAEAAKVMRMQDPGASYSGSGGEFALGIASFWSNLPGLKEFIDRNKIADAQGFSANYNKMILEVMSPLLKGAMSDRDMAIMRQSGPGLFMLPEGRQLMYDLIEENAARKRRVAEAASLHLQKNGNLMGFDERKAAGTYKPQLSVKARSDLPEEQQRAARDLAEKYARGEADVKAIKELVKEGLLMM
jgi:hypothetical protein